MALILDALVVLIVLFCIWNGWRKGFIKALSRLVSFLLALVITLLLSGPVAQLVYGTVIGPNVRESLTMHLNDETFNTVGQRVDAAMDTLPDFVRTLLDNQGLTSGDAVVNKLGGNADTATAMAEQIEATVIAPLVTMLLEAVCFLVLFLVASFIASLLFKVLDKVFDLPILRSINGTLGFIPGAINGALWALVLASVVQVLAATGAADGFITPAVLADTTVMQWLVSINPLADTLGELVTLTTP